MENFTPVSPDPSLIEPQDMSLAKFGHINKIVAELNTLKESLTANGNADVAGPASSTDNAIARYDSTTGKVIQDSLAFISDIGAILLPVGAVGTPSVQVGTGTKGFYAVSENQLGMVIGGSLVALVDSSGLMADSLRARVEPGSTPVGTAVASTSGDGKDFTTEIVLTNFIVGTLPGAAVSLGIGNSIYAFPAGLHFEIAYSMVDLVLTALGTPVVTETALGSVMASGAVSVLNGTPVFEDRITAQEITTDPSGGAAVSAVLSPSMGIMTGIALNGTVSIKNVFLNSAGAWNADNTGNLTATGKIVLKWTKMD